MTTLTAPETTQEQMLETSAPPSNGVTAAVLLSQADIEHLARAMLSAGGLLMCVSFAVVACLPIVPVQCAAFTAQQQRPWGESVSVIAWDSPATRVGRFTNGSMWIGGSFPCGEDVASIQGTEARVLVDSAAVVGALVLGPGVQLAIDPLSSAHLVAEAPFNTRGDDAGADEQAHNNATPASNNSSSSNSACIAAPMFSMAWAVGTNRTEPLLSITATHLRNPDSYYAYRAFVEGVAYPLRVLTLAMEGGGGGVAAVEFAPILLNSSQVLQTMDSAGVLHVTFEVATGCGRYSVSRSSSIAVPSALTPTENEMPPQPPLTHTMVVVVAIATACGAIVLAGLASFGCKALRSARQQRVDPFRESKSARVVGCCATLAVPERVTMTELATKEGAYFDPSIAAAFEGEQRPPSPLYDDASPPIVDDLGTYHNPAVAHAVAENDGDGHDDAGYMQVNGFL